MGGPLVVSAATLGIAGILVLTVVAVEAGGYYMLAVGRGRRELTGFQIGFARAGHAHAGVLVILSLVAQLYVDASGADGLLEGVAREGIPVAAVLMPAGFFLSSMGRGRVRPSRLIWLVYAGSLALGAGAVALGVAVIAG